MTIAIDTNRRTLGLLVRFVSVYLFSEEDPVSDVGKNVTTYERHLAFNFNQRSLSHVFSWYFVDELLLQKIVALALSYS